MIKNQPNIIIGFCFIEMMLCFVAFIATFGAEEYGVLYYFIIFNIIFWVIIGMSWVEPKYSYYVSDGPTTKEPED